MNSSVLSKGISFIKGRRRAGEDVKVSPGFADSDEFGNNLNIMKGSASCVESEHLEVKKVPVNTQSSGFSYFLDGIEKKKIAFYYRSIPIIYGYVAGVILKRTDKKLHSIGLEQFNESFYAPIKAFKDSPAHYFDPAEIAELGEKIYNIGKMPEYGLKKEYPVLPSELIQSAHTEIQQIRGKIENDLAKEWLDSSENDSWLFVDGRLENKKIELISSSKMVGVIKSHQANYFSYDDQYKIFSMEKGYRTSVFQPEDINGKKENVYSWYLRLHYNKKNGVNEFGLIRVEVPAKREFVEKADLISSWILLETKPVAFPASRWDRMIYPIKYCEDYLKSKAPSWHMIESMS